MHKVLFTSVCLCTLVLTWIRVPLTSMSFLLLAIAAICLIGVPHGGMDHVAGKKWLRKRWGKYWPLPFSVSYLAIAMVTIAGWLVCPLFTAMGFFMISANHFGREDSMVHLAYDSCARLSDRLWNSLSAIGSGGLVIWIPAVARPSEMNQILDSIVPASLGSTSEDILFWTQLLSTLFVPIALFEVFRSLVGAWQDRDESVVEFVRRVVLICTLIFIPIPISFTLFFCGWHSIRALQQLSLEHSMTYSELALATLPLSLGAIALCGLGMFFWNSGRTWSEEWTRTLFLGLSGMAVPHLVLHDLIPHAASRGPAIPITDARSTS